MFYQSIHSGTSEHFCKESGKNFNYPLHLHNSFEFINILQTYRHYNIILLVFSLLPIYPLDGFRLLDIYLKDNVVYKLSYIFIGIIFILNIYFKSVGMLIVQIFLLYKIYQKDFDC